MEIKRKKYTCMNKVFFAFDSSYLFVSLQDLICASYSVILEYVLGMEDKHSTKIGGKYRTKIMTQKMLGDL